MWKHLFIMVIVLGALIGADRFLRQQSASEREASARVGALFTEERFLENPVAAFRLETGADRIWVYYFDNGIWRSVNAYGQPGMKSKMDQLLPGMLSARGVIQARTSEHDREFGFGGPDRLVLAACGPDAITDPDGDIIAGIEIGKSIPETGGTFVRRLGEEAIWSVNLDFRGMIRKSSVEGIPPNLDPNVIPEVWPGLDVGVRSIAVRRFDGQESFRARRVERDTDPEQSGGFLGWEWVLETPDGQFSIDMNLLRSYLIFLTRMPYLGILSPGERPELGFEEPRAHIDIQTAEDQTMRLIIGAVQPRGGVAVLNSFTQVGYLVDAQQIRLALPPIDDLLGSPDDDPWEPWIRPERDQPIIPEGMELPPEFFQ